MLVLDDKGSEQTKHKKTFQAKLIKLTILINSLFTERAQDNAVQEKAGPR